MMLDTKQSVLKKAVELLFEGGDESQNLEVFNQKKEDDVDSNNG